MGYTREVDSCQKGKMKYIIIIVMCLSLSGCAEKPIIEEIEYLREGIIKAGFEFYDNCENRECEVIMEVGEIERLGVYSKIQILDISGTNDRGKKWILETMSRLVLSEKVYWVKERVQAVNLSFTKEEFLEMVDKPTKQGGQNGRNMAD